MTERESGGARDVAYERFSKRFERFLIWVCILAFCVSAVTLIAGFATGHFVAKDEAEEAERNYIETLERNHR